MSSSSPNGRTLSPDTTPLQPVQSPPDAATSFPLAAQIPIKSFTLPTFPPEASHLRELTLTSDIKLDEYQNELRGKEYELPNLPQSITHLTLELFSLGFPGRNPKFLTNLANSLPNLKSLTLFSCLIDGLSEASRTDAEAFFDLSRQLREVHVIDSFARPGFWSTVSKNWATRAKELREVKSDGGVKVVEISYTFRGHDHDDFHAKLHGEELPSLLVPGMVGFGCGMVEAAEGEDLGDNKEVAASGVLPFANDSRATTALRERFESLSGGELGSLRVLNLGLWTLKAFEIGRIEYACSKNADVGAGLMDLTVSVLMDDGWFEKFVSALKQSPSLEGIEIVGVPAKAKEEGEDWKSGEGLIMVEEEAQKLGEACPRLARFEMSILKARKAGGVVWTRESEGGEWKRKA